MVLTPFETKCAKGSRLEGFTDSEHPAIAVVHARFKLCFRNGRLPVWIARDAALFLLVWFFHETFFAETHICEPHNIRLLHRRDVVPSFDRVPQVQRGADIFPLLSRSSCTA